MTLAGGQSVNMRMNSASTLLFPPKPDDAQAANMPIIPMGELVQTLGYKMEWAGKRCKLVGREGEVIQLNVRQNCAVLTEAQALRLISRLEDVKLKGLEEKTRETKNRVQAAALRLEEDGFQKMLRYVVGKGRGRQDRAFRGSSLRGHSDGKPGWNSSGLPGCHGVGTVEEVGLLESKSAEGLAEVQVHDPASVRWTSREGVVAAPGERC